LRTSRKRTRSSVSSPANFHVTFSSGFKFIAPLLLSLCPDRLSACTIFCTFVPSTGVDFTAASQLGRHAVWALSLPGKVAPVSSARAIRDTIYTILQEENIL
jgi:hypothetical protein